MSNPFLDAGACKEARDGHHSWIDITAENEEPGKHYLCTSCGREAFDQVSAFNWEASPTVRQP
jgi:hypothetical protein